MDRPLVRIPAYIAFGFAVFLVALVLTFPDDRIKEIVTVQLESRLGNKYDVSIGDLDLWWLSGVKLNDVTISEHQIESNSSDKSDDKGAKGKDAKKAAANQPPKEKPLRVEIPEIAVGFSPLSSLVHLAPTVDFNVDLGGGDVSGDYVQGSDKRSVDVDIDDIDLAKTPVLESLLGVPFLGTLGGDVHLDFHPTRQLITGGHITLTGRKLAVDKATLHTNKLGPMAFIDVPHTDLGKLDANLVINKPKGRPSPTVDFKRFEFHDGKDVRGQIWGDIDLGRTLPMSRAKLKMRFQFADKYIRSNDLSSVLRMKWFRDGKNKDWYGFVLLGHLGRPRFEGAPTAASGPQKSASKDTHAKAKPAHAAKHK